MSHRKLTQYIKSKRLDRWLVGYLRQALKRKPGRGDRPTHIMFALCDHFEPLSGHRVSKEIADRRVTKWIDQYPVLAKGFVDSDGFSPRHSFFFAGEEYYPFALEGLAQLVRLGFGEVELHLHHDNDTVGSLRDKISLYLQQFAEHGHFSLLDGRRRYAFIHGNWCLSNARSDGRWCGVDAELPLLHETGCYADFTFPAAPDESQPGIVNQIYWPVGDLSRRRAYEWGRPAQVGQFQRDRVLIVQGPLALSPRLSWRALGIETGALTATNPATSARVREWVRQSIGVVGRPEWVFVKVYTHGADERESESLLGDGGHRLHETLARDFNDGDSYRLHYVTAREMYNISAAAMCGETGNPGEFRDFLIPPPPAAQH